jgi:Fur family peroxide stress response transcriptional regulator
MVNIDSKEILIQNDIRPSLNRVMILDYLNEHRTHPTVDEIYLYVKEKNSILSKMTVYNVLNVLKDAHIIREIKIDSNETRYDIDTSCHGHFKCKKCGKIVDFDVDIDSIKIKDLDKFQIEQKDLYFYGVCSDCKEK